MGTLVTSSYIERLKAVYDKLITCLEMLEKRKDSRATFTYAYCIMTKSIMEKFNSANFKNPEWIASLTEIFANHYLEAISSYDTTQKAEGAWQKAFDTICKCKTSVMEELLISMYVHIMQDLALSLAFLNKNNPQFEAQIGDFHIMNEILQESINNIQDDIGKRYNPYLNWFDVIGKNRDELFTNYGIRICRSMAWYNSIRIMDPEINAEAVTSLEKSAGTFISDVRWNKSWFVRNLLTILRFLLNSTRVWPSAK